MSQPLDLLLIPYPREVEDGAGSCRLAAAPLIRLEGQPAAELLAAARRLQAALATTPNLGPAELSASPGARAQFVLRLEPAASHVAEGYRLHVRPEGVEVAGSDPAGVFYGVCTLIQLLRQFGAELPCLLIRDWPDLAARGVMLDVSRDKVPTLPTLYQLVDLLASLKLNQLQLYMEHTFAYPAHREVWAQASPLTADDILALDEYCRQRYVELVPNQNSFGHMGRWLKHPAYRHLAEAPDGFTPPWGGHCPAQTLSPTNPESIEFMAGLYDELLPNFRSRLFNVGCDETWELGQGQSRAACEKLGTGRVYWNFLRQIYELCQERGRRMQFWGDIIVKHPELIAELPRDIVAMEWGYEADSPLESEGAAFAAAGIPFYVCPGTSSWNSVAGRTDNCLGNLRMAAAAAVENGAIGYLITDWGDSGHWQPLPVSYLGYAVGAACAWALDANQERDPRPALSLQCFRDPSGVLGEVACDLGNAYRVCGKLVGNASLLHRNLLKPLGESDDGPIAEVSAEKLRETLAWVDGCLARLGEQRSNAPDAALVQREFESAGRLLAHSCRLALFRRQAPGEPRRGWADALAGELRSIMASQREVWLARNRTGGLADSLARLEARLADYQQAAR